MNEFRNGTHGHLESGPLTPSSLPDALSKWLADAANIRLMPVRSPERMSDTILLLRRAEELISAMIGWAAGFEHEHSRLSEKANNLLDASTPGPNLPGDLKHWSIADEFAPGRAGAFRKALNELVKYLSEK